MKFSSVTALFFNLCFRVYILIHLLQENDQDNWDKKALKQWMDPVSKRIIFISVNGLGKDFLRLNATPYMQEMVNNYGFAGIVTSSYFETNDGGLKTLLTGRSGHSTPIFWTRPRCGDTFLKYARCKCGMGNITSDVPLKCFYFLEKPLENFLKFPTLFDPKNTDSCFYLINFDIDPVLVSTYPSKISKIDADIKLLANTIDSVWSDNKTTYIVTSARGSPVGDSLSIDSPIVAWGRGIAYSEDIWMIHRSDITAMLCVLLGANFPTGLIGIVPLSVMDLSDYYKFEWTLYTIKHFETILELVDVRDHNRASSELEMEQLFTRMNTIVMKLTKKESIRWMSVFGWLIFSYTAWGVYLMSVSAAGYGQITWNLKGLFGLVVGIGIVMAYFPTDCELKIPFLVLLWLMYNSSAHVRKEMKRSGKLCCLTFSIIFTGVVFIGAVGNHTALPVLFAPIVFWPVYNGILCRLNILILITRLMSGVALTALLFSRVFGEMPNTFVISLTSILFVVQFNVLFCIFKKPIDLHVKAVYLFVLLTSIHISLLNKGKSFPMQNLISIALIVLFLISLSLISGSLLERLMKVFLSFFIPVQMLSIQIECIFYFSIVLHMFTWVFIEYHTKNTSPKKILPGIFFVDPNNYAKCASYSLRKIIFFLLYVYVSYHAMGHHPDLHSYDFYVLPNFFFRYPQYVSYFLAGLKFFVPFFIPTITVITLTNLEEKDSEFQLTTFLWASDMASCILIVCFGFLNKIFVTEVFPGKFTYVVIQQCGNVCLIVSYLLGCHLLFNLKPWFGCLIPAKRIAECEKEQTRQQENSRFDSVISRLVKMPA